MNRNLVVFHFPCANVAALNTSNSCQNIDSMVPDNDSITRDNNLCYEECGTGENGETATKVTKSGREQG